jgi:hypothetical protein
VSVPSADVSDKSKKRKLNRKRFRERKDRKSKRIMHLVIKATSAFSVNIGCLRLKIYSYFRIYARIKCMASFYFCGF